jgi:ribonuclease P protein component
MTRQRKSNLTTFFEKASKSRGRFFNSFLLIELNTSARKPIIYVLTSKKAVDKRATRRNLARRRLKAAQREVIVKHPLPLNSPQVTWVLTAGRAAVTAEWTQLITATEQQWLSVLATLP